jgi:hypothetical protein
MPAVRPILPTPEHHVKMAGPEQEVVLWRACTHGELAAIRTHLTAAGEAKNATAGRGAPGAAVEFSTSSLKARMLGAGGFVVYVALCKKHLTKRPGSAGGWECPPGAPIRFLGFEAGPPAGGLRP